MSRFILFYTDPAKSGLQKIQIGLMALLIPVALLLGVPAVQNYFNFQKAAEHLIKADALTHQGQDQAALAELEKCVALYPEFYEAYELMASLNYDRSNRSAAIDSYNRGLAVMPDHAELHYGLAQLLYLEKRYDESRQHAQRAADLNPADVRASHLVERCNAPHEHEPLEPELSHPPSQ